MILSTVILSPCLVLSDGKEKMILFNIPEIVNHVINIDAMSTLSI